MDFSVPELPEDCWTVIFEFVSPRDVAAVRGVSRDLRLVATRDIVWDLRIRDWGGARPACGPGSRRGEAMGYFAAKVYDTRRIPLHNCASIYNAAYHCVVSAATFSSIGMTLQFAARGDRSLGPLQVPFSSQITTWDGEGDLITRLAVESTLSAVTSTPVNDVLSAQFGTDEIIMGHLCYPLNTGTLFYLKDATLQFRFGQSGYSNAHVLRLTPLFLRVNHLDHFRWAKL